MARNELPRFSFIERTHCRCRLPCSFVREIERIREQQLSTHGSHRRRGGHFSFDRSSFEFFRGARKRSENQRQIVYFQNARLDRDRCRYSGQRQIRVLLRVNYGHTDSRNFASWNRMRLDATMGFQWQCFFHVDAGSRCTRCLIFYYSAGSYCMAKIGSR